MNSLLIKRPGLQRAADRLKETGLAVEYFPVFTQQQHHFHTHEFVEILFVLNGTFRHVTADRTYDESTGGLSILNYNQFHTLKTPNGPVELINIYWNLKKLPMPSLPEALATRLYELIPAHPMFGHRLNRIRHLQVKETQSTAQLLLQLLREQNNPTAGSEVVIDALFRLFLIELCRAAPTETETDKSLFNPRMETVRRYLEAHFNEPVQLEQLCKISRTRKANLCQQFKKYTGVSTGEYLKQLRLTAALRKLRTTNDKILAICHDCGFSDISNFNRAFRAALNQTPSEYRSGPNTGTS